MRDKGMNALFTPKIFYTNVFHAILIIENLSE